MGKREHKHLTGSQEVAILRQALVDGQIVAEVRGNRGLSPTLLFEAQQQFFDNGAAAFAKDKGGEERGLERQVDHPQARLAPTGKSGANRTLPHGPPPGRIPCEPPPVDERLKPG